MKLRKEAKVGIFGILMVLVLYWGINFLKGQDIFARNNTYYAALDQVNGIQTSSAIVIKGYKVGVISGMNYQQGADGKIVLELSVKSKNKIPTNSKALIFSEGIVGGKSVEIQLGSAPQYLQSGDTLYSEVDKGFLEVAGSEFEYIKQMLHQLVGDISTTLGSVNKILVDNTASINATMGNLASISGNIDDVISSESGSLKGMISNLNTMSRNLKDNSERIDHIIANVEHFTDSLSSSHIPTMVNEFTTTLGKLNATIGKINAGEGALGQLVNDPALYDSLTVASGNLAALLADLKANPKRYVHFSVFGGSNKEKKKAKTEDKKEKSKAK